MRDKPFPASRKTNSALPRDDGDMVDSPNAYQSIMDRGTIDFFTSFDFIPLTVFEDTCRFVPKTHLAHEPEKITITAELPGVEAADISITIKPDMLIIAGKDTGAGEDALPVSMQDKYGPKFFRTLIPIPCLIDMQNVKAVFSKGILQIKLSKISQNGMTRFRIPIKKD